MDHITFAKFPDRQRATEGLNSIRQNDSSAEVLMHWGAKDAASFEQQVQHSGEFGETDVRHAMLLGAGIGLLGGAAFGALLAVIEIFPGTAVHGLVFGAVMGVLVGLLMMSIIGTGLVDRRLMRLTRDLHDGQVVLTVRTKNRAAHDLAQQTLAKHGAEIAEKSVA